jgi:DNA helicase II / ATP-dependent DNA helicase PcrA
MGWKEKLSAEQLVAVTQAGSHARLLAGPGTGKTLCLTRRVIRLLEDEGLQPSQIPIITFTRAARAELRSRILAEVGDEARLPQVSTLHSYALRVLLRHPGTSSLPQPLRITDDWEDRQIIEEELKILLELGRLKDSRDLLTKLSADWETLTADGADWETHFPNPRFLGAWREHRRVYGYTLRSELVYALKHAIDEGQLGDFRAPRNLVVDEYQDLNACDLAVIRNLTERGAELYCAGDDDQSIYGFRYASPAGIRRFDTDYAPSRYLELAECKRCDRKILEYALFVATQDSRRIPKRLESSVDAGSGEVHVLHFTDQRKEADGVANICEHLVLAKRVPPGEILILLRNDRSGTFSQPLKNALDRRQLPASVGVDPLAPLNEPEGRTFLSILRLVDNPNDSLAWRSLLEVRKNGIGTGTLMKVYQLARSRGVSFLAALELVRTDPLAIEGKGPALAQEIGAVRVLLEQATALLSPDLAAFSRQVAEMSITAEDTRALVVDLVQRALDLSSAADLSELLRAVQTAIGDKEAERDPTRISIMTMHQAKGLTADAVLVVGAEDERIPGNSQGDTLDDERRLLYVSLSRARHFLYVTYCNRRTGSQSFSGNAPGVRSRSLTQFLRDAPTRPEPGAEYLDGLGRPLP